jgi:hypothetical protein
MKRLFALLLMFSGLLARAQNSTDELLDAKTVRNYIHFSMIDKKLYYELDRNTDKKSHKTLPTDFCIAVNKSDNEVAIVFDFINPFKQKIVLSETLEPDGAYESLSKFYTAMKGLSGQLSNASASETTKSTINAAGYKIAGETSAATSAKDKVALLTAKSLTEWKYAFLVSTANCVKATDLFQSLVIADKEFYRKSDDANIDNFFPFIVRKINQDLLSQESVTKLSAYNSELPTLIGDLEKQNENASTLLNALKSWNYATTFDTSIPACSKLSDYTKEKIDQFVDDAKALLEKRKAILVVLKDLNKNTTDFLKKCEEKDNLMIVGRIPVSVEQVKIQTIKLREVDFKLDNNEIVMVEDEKKDVELGKVRIRNYHLFIPEFALGAFYTNLDYPSYGTTSTGGSTVISGPNIQNYSLIAAANLNLVVNLHGLVNPMLQFGVGTAKELPSFLAGGGLRLSKPNHLSISFGGLWTWKKDLDKLKVGDVIGSSADLDKDLKYKFITKPSFYLGINFGF